MKKIIFTALFFAVGLGLSADDWPQWRGPNRDGISRETGLLQAWPSAGPKRVWLSRDIGIGYSAPVVAGGKVFIMGTKDGKEQLFAKEAKGGKTLWTARWAASSPTTGETGRAVPRRWTAIRFMRWGQRAV